MGDNASLPAYTVRRSKRARRIRLRVDMSGAVEVVLPTRAPLREAAPFVKQHAEWLHRTLARFEQMRAARATQQRATAGTVSYRGRSIPLRIQPAQDCRLSLQYRDDHFLIKTPPEATDEDVKALLRRWYRAVARPLFEERVTELNQITRYPWKRIRIADQKTRWGSCSTSGTLSFNWKLLSAPADVLDYVVLHELAHIKEPNHSPRFWALVEAACPRYRDHILWLKQYGATLGI